MNLSQIDNESGIDATKTLYAIKDGNNWSNWQISNIFEQLKPNTQYTIKTKATDKAGNTSESKEIRLQTEAIKEEKPNIKEEQNKPENEIDISVENKNTLKDNTVANIKIPKTGDNNNLILLVIAFLIVIAIRSYNKLKSI